MDTLCHTVDLWNEDYPQPQQPECEEQQEEQPGETRHEIGQEQAHEEVQDDAITVASSQVNPPPGLTAPSMAGSASTVVVSTLEMPLFKGSKRVFVRDSHLSVVGKYVVIDRWFVAMITGRGSIIIDESAPQDIPVGTAVRTGQDDMRMEECC